MEGVKKGRPESSDSVAPGPLENRFVKRLDGCVGYVSFCLTNGHALKGAQRKMKITPTPPSPVEGEGIMPRHPGVSTLKGRGIVI